MLTHFQRLREIGEIDSICLKESQDNTLTVEISIRGMFIPVITAPRNRPGPVNMLANREQIARLIPTKHQPE